MTLHPMLLLVVVAGVLLVLAVFSLFRGRARRGAKVRNLVLAVLLVAILLRPTVGHRQIVTYSPGVDVVIMIDRTTSMAAEDWDGAKPRLDGVKEDLTQIISKLSGSRFAIVVFDNNARLALPFTTDAKAAIALVDAIGWRETDYGSGTDVSIGVSLAAEQLSQSQTKNPSQGRYFIYVGDGEQTTTDTRQSFGQLSGMIDGGLVLGYGTVTGGPMKVRVDSDQYVQFEGEKAVSKLDGQTLQTIANELQVTYRHRTQPGPISVPIDKMVLVPTVYEDSRGFELYWVFALAAALVVGSQVWDSVGRRRLIEEEKI